MGSIVVFLGRSLRESNQPSRMEERDFGRIFTKKPKISIFPLKIEALEVDYDADRRD